MGKKKKNYTIHKKEKKNYTYTLEKKNYIHKRKFLLEGKKNNSHKLIHPTDQQIKILFWIKGK